MQSCGANLKSCRRCAGTLSQPQKIGSHCYTDFGFPVFLINSVIEQHCATCSEVEHTVPNVAGLMAAAALYRISLAQKLLAAEIRFIRKSLRINAISLANLLEVTAETLSRWENGKLTMSPTSEKLLRLIAIELLGDRAPGVEVDRRQVANLRIQPLRDPGAQLAMAFELVKVRHLNKAEEAYSLAA